MYGADTLVVGDGFMHEIITTITLSNTIKKFQGKFHSTHLHFLDVDNTFSLDNKDLRSIDLLYCPTPFLGDGYGNQYSAHHFHLIYIKGVY